MAEAPKLKERYGVDPTKMYADSGKVHDHARSLFAVARKMFEKDGHHITIVILLRGGKPIDFLQHNQPRVDGREAGQVFMDEQRDRQHRIMHLQHRPGCTRRCARRA